MGSHFTPPPPALSGVLLQQGIATLPLEMQHARFYFARR